MSLIRHLVSSLVIWHISAYTMVSISVPVMCLNFELEQKIKNKVF